MRSKVSGSSCFFFSSPCAASNIASRRTCLLVAFALLAAAAFAGTALSAQALNRITQVLDTSQAQPLPNHHPLWASPANSTGLAPADLPLNQITLVLSRSAQQEAAFQQFLADQQNPASPDYHHWLTPAEVGDRFGLSDQDIATISAWLQSQGLHVNWVAPSRIFIGFSGTAADVGRAFQTEMQTYSVSGQQRLSVSSNPMVPAALAPAIKAIRGLYTINEHPMHHTSAVQSVSPQYTSSSSGNHYIGPKDFSTIYDLPSSYTGAGITIGIVSWSRTYAADFDNFKSKTGVTFADPIEVVPTAYGGIDPGPALTAVPSGSSSTLAGQGEATLDVTRAGSVAPGASLLLVVSSSAGSNDGIGADAQYLVGTSPVPAQVMSISFGACESDAGPKGVAFWDSLFQTAVAEGISVFVSSGDSGAAGCDTNFAAPPASPLPNSPNYICSSSYATCVGGTQFADISNSSTYWNPSNDTNLASARSYIPEGAWNESTTTSVAGSGGGVSAVIATPSWQAGIGVPSARAGRYTPDVSFSASAHDGYIACMAAYGATCSGTSSGLIIFSGTSASAPGMAGVAALLDQKLGAAQGNLNPAIYSTASGFPTAFHDVTVTTSAVSGCSINTTSICNNSVANASGGSAQAGYLVGTGYDEATGLGSLDVQSFLNNFTTKIAPLVTVIPSATSITTVQGLNVAISVSGSSGGATPTGSVTLTAGSYISAPTVLSSGSASINIPAGSLAVGTDALSVYYTPDSASSATYSNSSGLNSVTVSQTTPTVTVSLSSTNITTAQPLTVTVAVSGGTGSLPPTGSISLSGGGYSTGPVTLTSGNASITLAAGLLTVGVDTLTAIYTPDTQGFLTYLSAQGSNSVTVTAATKLTPTVTVTPPGVILKNTVPLAIAITVSGVGSNPTPTGSVTLISGSYSSAATPLNNGSASVSIPAGTLPIGVSTLTAVYAPDSASSGTYNNASGSAVVNITQSVLQDPGVQVLASSSNLTTAQALTVTVIVRAATGTVTVTTGNYTSAPATLVSYTAAFAIPIGTLPVGVDTLTATYTPDAASSSTFSSGSGSTTVTVTAPPPPSFTVSGTAVTISTPGATTGNTSTITITPVNGFTGSVTLTAAITSSPSGAQYPPTLSFGSTSPVSITSASAGTATLTVSTTAGQPVSCTATNQTPHGIPWYAQGSAVLACLLFFGIAPLRRKGRAMLSMLLLLVALAGGMLACGGGSKTVACSTAILSGTTAGSYTITLTASGTSSTQKTSTIALTVQ